MGKLGSQRRLPVLLGTLLFTASVGTSACAQDAGRQWESAAGGRQQFDVASVRENKAGGQSSSNFSLDGNGNAYWVMDKGDKTAPEGDLFRATNQTLMRYIIFAYGLSGTEELALRLNFWAGVGMKVPEWVNMTRYDIEARAPGPATKDQMRLMMQGLLAERFKLAVHRETRQAPVFAMTLEKAGTPGPDLRAHPASDTCATTEYPEKSAAVVSPAGVTEKAAAGAATADGTLPIPCAMIARLPASAPGRHRIGGRDVTMAMIAESLPGQTGLAEFPRPVVDATGLSGTFDFTLEWAQPMAGDMAGGPNAQADEPGPTMAKALKEQLGIRLESTRGPVQIMVIDHVEKPTAN